MATEPPGLTNRLSHGRPAWAILAGLLAVYGAAFAVFYPRTITVVDELGYVRQAQRIATGVETEPIRHPLTGETIDFEIKAVYPVGTALTLAPWIALGGWRLAFLGPVLCLIAAVGVTGLWLAREGRSPLAASVLLAFPAAAVLGRVCMSETPSLLWVSLGLLLFWRGLDGQRAASWGAAGFVAGTSLLLRESNVLLFAPLFVGALVRRERAAWTLVVGGLVGVGLRLLSGQLVWGDPFHYKSPGYGFGPDAIPDNLLLYGFALLIAVPGGLVAGLAYRGRRWPEVVTTVVLFVTFYLLYDYSGGSSGGAKRLILGPRFFVPLLPLLAFALAEAVPRAWHHLQERGSRIASPRLADAAVFAWIAGVAVASVGVHVVHDRWSASQADLRESIYAHTPDGAVVVSNSRALSKYISPIYGRRTHLDRDAIGAPLAAALVERNEVFYLVLLDRTDSEHWRRDARRNAVYLKSFYPEPELTLDLTVSPSERLRIFEVREIQGGF